MISGAAMISGPIFLILALVGSVRGLVGFVRGQPLVSNSRQQTADSRQQTADSKQQASGIRHQASGSRHQAAGINFFLLSFSSESVHAILHARECICFSMLNDVGFSESVKLSLTDLPTHVALGRPS
jgi:hypothetical protein